MVLFLFSQNPGKDLNTLSLLLITMGLFLGVVMHILFTKEGENKKKQLKIALGWICWAVSYILISIRLALDIDDAELHIVLYQIILTLDAFGFSCFFFFIADNFTYFPNSRYYTKRNFDLIGIVLFIVQVPFIWLVGGFGVKDTPFGVEILPSFVCQNIMATAMIIGGILFLFSATALKSNNNVIAARVCIILSFFMIVLILHIFTTVLLGHTFFSGLILLLARLFLGSCPVLTALIIRKGQ